MKNEKEDKLQDRMAAICWKVAVMSGKGGVGKSTVALSLAHGLLFQGQRVGLLDADLHGPSIGKMLGIDGQSSMPASDEGMLEPYRVAENFKAMSMAMLLNDPDQSVIWRGPMKANAIGQFLADVNWGTLDYLVIDLPPGTGDEPLTIAQRLPDLDGTIIVTTPQDLALLDARKAVHFARQLNLPVLGIVENMSGFTCPHCGHSLDLFKSGGGEVAAEELAVPFLGRIPFELGIVQAEDAGETFLQAYGKTEAAAAMETIVDRVAAAVTGSRTR